jgi:hypothetical protein
LFVEDRLDIFNHLFDQRDQPVLMHRCDHHHPSTTTHHHPTPVIS